MVQRFEPSPVVSNVTPTSVSFVFNTATARSQNIQEVVAIRFRLSSERNRSSVSCCITADFTRERESNRLCCFAAPFNYALNVTLC
ncbi:GPI-anchored surface protein, putative [Bodo saltans]|uniref:GPI-anchored surface protein, putative n=1 Tax=Bodo saltans TaxID=75058 RepID=A0A0S4J8Z4_BODSA|nr:GPI-anchored surface protein, putative [Bodo saltans]|eukprot:CUG86998.1 GPI-anchored surface protein, putative [Bodo saltans]